MWDSRSLANEINLEGKDRIGKLAMELAVRVCSLRAGRKKDGQSVLH